MKKLLLFTAAFAALAISCTKEANPAVEPETSLKAAPTEFTATIDEALTRTSLSQDGSVWKVLWNAGDAISVFDASGNKAKYVAQSSGASTAFTLEGESALSGDTFYAVYPYKDSDTFSEGVLSTSTADAAISSPGSFTNAETAVMTAKSSSDKLSFKNLSSLLKFTIPEGLTMEYLIFYTSSQGVAGNVTVSIADDGTPSVVTAPTAIPNMKINKKDGTPSLEAGDYYMPILPGTYGSMRMMLGYNSTDKSDAFSLDSFTAESGKVINIGTIYDNRDYYKWLTFENGVAGRSYLTGNTNAFSVVANPVSDEVNGTSKVLKNTVVGTTGTSGYVNIEISSLNENVRKRLKIFRFQIYLNGNDYYPRIKLNSDGNKLPTAINGVKPSGDTFTETEFKAALKSGWNTMEISFSQLSSGTISDIQIRPMCTFAGANVEGTSDTNNRTVYLDNIGFSSVE